MEEDKILKEEELSDVLKNAIQVKLNELKLHNPKHKLFVIVVDGDVEYGEQEHYIGYFKRPSMAAFSKYLSFSSSNQVAAMKALAKDCFVDGDRDLVESDDVFMFGLMPQLVKVIEARQGRVVNFTKSGK